MAQMKQVAVRMGDKLHSESIKTAQRENMSFGEFMRNAAGFYIDALKRGPRKLRNK